MAFAPVRLLKGEKMIASKADALAEIGRLSAENENLRSRLEEMRLQRNQEWQRAKDACAEAEMFSKQTTEAIAQTARAITIAKAFSTAAETALRERDKAS